MKIKEKIQTKWLNFKMGVSLRLRAIKNWISRNKEVTILLILALGPKLLNCVGKFFSYRKEKKVQDKRECGYYDPRTGEWWTTRKPLNSYEKLELERRYKSGESKGQILSSMRKL